MHFSRHCTVRSVWKVIFCVAAVLEIQYIVWARRQVDVGDHDSAPESCTIHYTVADRAWESTRAFSVWAGPMFCVLCLMESLVRAVEARKSALDNRVLAELEASLLRTAQKSSDRLSMFFTGAVADQGHKKATKQAFAVLRSWIPAVATIALWLFLLPTDLADFRHRCGPVQYLDSAVAAQWIRRISLACADILSSVHGLLEDIFWTKVLPYRIYKQPQRFLQRLQVILRWIRFARFAGPLFRMGLKLQDQLRAVWKARRQTQNIDTEKQRRIDMPSLILADIQKLLQQKVVQTTLALPRLPSFRLLSHPALTRISSSVVNSYNNKRNFGKTTVEQLENLQRDCHGSFTATSELYDRITKLTHDIHVTHGLQSGYYSHHYLQSLRALLSSSRCLISPRTRFSLAWRVTVTNCLLLEIGRLCASWYLSETFAISLSQILSLLIKCKAPAQAKHHLAFITDQVNNFRRHLFDALPILGPSPVDVSVCIPAGPQATLMLHFGRSLEMFVDAVAFFDILVWFLTGDIDIDTHAVIPKPFFTRCILPGALVQVLDHPTLPYVLPTLLKDTLSLFASLGHARCLRWILAISPALKMMVLDPMIDFFFQHIEEDEGLMHIAETVGMLSPERKSGLFGSTGSLGAGSSSSSRKHVSRRPSSQAFSNVGLAYDASPVSSRHELGSLPDGVEPLPLPLHPPSFLGMAVHNCPLKKHKSVHFGLADNDNQCARKEEVETCVRAS